LRERLERRIAADEGLLATVDRLLVELRRVEAFEPNPTEKERYKLYVAAQERNQEEISARLDQLRRELAAVPNSLLPGPPPAAAAPVHATSPSAAAPAAAPSAAAMELELAAPVQRAAEPQARPYHVFISYTREDSPPKRTFVDRLLLHLEPTRREGLVSIWMDRRIEIGERWHAEIAASLAAADCAVLMISERFLASSYVRKHELSLLLERNRVERLPLLPLVIDTCDVAHARYRFPDPATGPYECVLSSLQAATSREQPLIVLSEAEVGKALMSVATAIRRLAEKHLAG
jgi:hypothetical protein